MNIDNNASKKFDKKPPLIGKTSNKSTIIKEVQPKSSSPSSLKTDIKLSNLKEDNKFKQKPLRKKLPTHETKLIPIQPSGVMDIDDTPSKINDTLELSEALKK